MINLYLHTDEFSKCSLLLIQSNIWTICLYKCQFHFLIQKAWTKHGRHNESTCTFTMQTKHWFSIWKSPHQALHHFYLSGKKLNFLYYFFFYKVSNDCSRLISVILCEESLSLCEDCVQYKTYKAFKCVILSIVYWSPFW